jgi:chromate transporter
VVGVCLGLWSLPFVLSWGILGRGSVFFEEAKFFSQAAVVTFGGAYAVLAYVAQHAVDVLGWLKPGEMLDGLGLAETTPGPLILVVEFVGFQGAFRSPGGLPPLVAGAIGATVTAWVTFVPCFLWIFLGAPYIEKLRGNRALDSALSSITAAVVGVIANLTLWFSIHFLFAKVETAFVGPLRYFQVDLASLDLLAAGIAALAMVALLRLKWGVPKTLLGAAALALAARAFKAS